MDKIIGGLFVVLAAAGFFLGTSQPASATHFYDVIRGRILLDVEQNGEGWYVYPADAKRYYLGRPADAFAIMRNLSLGITDTDLAKIPTSTSTDQGDLGLRQRLSGRILLQVEGNGEAWYVYPETLKRYYLGRPADAFQIMSSLGLGISSANLAHIPAANTFLQPESPPGLTFERKSLVTSRGTFTVDVATLDRSQYEMVTDTANLSDCANDCPAKSLAEYVSENNAVAGIHGTYFCPPDYVACAGKTYSYTSPVYNSETGQLINEEGLKYFSRPLLVMGEDGTYELFHRADELGSTAKDIEDHLGSPLKAAIGSWPSLRENGQTVVSSEPMESPQTTKATRGGIGYNENRIFLVIAHTASVTDMAAIFESLEASDAINLDGGGSAALYVNGSYKVGPGRLLPNAIVFRKK